MLTTNSSIHAYVNRINNRLVFKIKGGYELGLQKPEIMKLFGSIKNLISKTKNGKNVPSLQVVVLAQYNLVDNRQQQDIVDDNNLKSFKCQAKLLGNTIENKANGVLKNSQLPCH